MTPVFTAVVIPNPHTGKHPLIVYVSVDFTDLSTLGKSYRWPRLRRCPRCRGYRLWGHGYVERFFDGTEKALWMKRRRCPDCHAVHTLRPNSHWRGFWADRSTILRSLECKDHENQWVSTLSRERQQYWWRGFRIQRNFDGAFASLAILVKRKVIVATHSLTYREVRRFEFGTHRIFAFTPSLHGP